MSELQKAAREVLDELGYVWLGDLAGFDFAPHNQHPVALHHRCGWAAPLLPQGGSFLADVVQRALEHRAEGCQQPDPSPEHRARVARWAAAAGAQPSGDVAQDQLSIVRAVAASSRRRPLADGPGCTPAVIHVECLGDACTGCSDSQCWTARADGGDV